MAVETRSAIDLIRLLGGVVRLLTFYSDDSSSNITIKTKIGPFKKKFLLIRLIYTISLKGGQMVIVLAYYSDVPSSNPCSVSCTCGTRFYNTHFRLLIEVGLNKS